MRTANFWKRFGKLARGFSALKFCTAMKLPPERTLLRLTRSGGTDFLAAVPEIGL